MDRMRLEVEPLVDEAVAAFADTAAHREVSLQKETLGDLPSVRGDPDRLVEVLSNLLSNAVKIVPKGGVVTVRAEDEGSHVHLLVADNGPWDLGGRPSTSLRPVLA